jgi:hypothetical protein
MDANAPWLKDSALVACVERAWPRFNRRQTAAVSWPGITATGPGRVLGPAPRAAA